MGTEFVHKINVTSYPVSLKGFCSSIGVIVLRACTCNNNSHTESYILNYNAFYITLLFIKWGVKVKCELTRKNNVRVRNPTPACWIFKYPSFRPLNDFL